MADRMSDRLGNWMEQRLLRRFGEIADRAATDGLSGSDRTRALAFRQRIDRALREAEDSRAGAPELPPHADWWWRPDFCRFALPSPGVLASGPETRLSEDLRIFHDCPLGEVIARQSRNHRDSGGRDFGLTVDIYRFGGSYLSLVVEVPEEAVQALRNRHVIRLDMRLETERPTEALARLNILHGPNTERIVRDLRLTGLRETVDFDLAVTRIDTARTRRMWIDLIFERPEMNALAITDLALVRRPRAEI